MSLRIDNQSGYDTADLRRFIRRGLAACGVRGAIHVTVTAAPGRSRGCATVGGRRMNLALASPSYSRGSFDSFLRRLGNLLQHEAAHLRGMEHHQMPPTLLMSHGPIPAWAKGAKIRYLGRAPDQMRHLR